MLQPICSCGFRRSLVVFRVGSLPCLESFRGHSDLCTAGRKETQCRDECEKTKPQRAPSWSTGVDVPCLKVTKVLILSIVV